MQLRLFDLPLFRCSAPLLRPSLLSSDPAGTKKPLFFAQKRDMFLVEPSTGGMFNTDDGAPMVPITEEELPAWYVARGGSDKLLSVALLSGERAPVYQGGSVEDLHKML